MILALFSAATSLLTPRAEPQGEVRQPEAAPVTSCSNVDLSSILNYRGVVKSGYLSTGRGASALAFIFYGKKGVVDESLLKTFPTLIWLNGGPGSSSQLGNLFELGPIWVKGRSAVDPNVFTYRENNNSWVSEYNVLFVDNPVGTGLSYADVNDPNAFVTNMSTLSSDFYRALKELYQNANGCFNKLGIKDSMPLFITGESYAGKYVPAIAAYILSLQNETKFLTGLKGIAIGDPFTEPMTTLREMGNFGTMLGLLDNQERTGVEQLVINASFQERRREWRDMHDSFNKILDRVKRQAGGVNVYNIREYRDYEMDLIRQFFESEPGKLFNFSKDVQFDGQKGYVQYYLYEDFMRSYTLRVEYCLLKGLPVLVYSGQNDLICNTPATTSWLERLDYPDRAEFAETLMTPWRLGGLTAGYQKAAGQLRYVVFKDAGHLIPMDQPGAALAMIKEFVGAHK